jgi:hypothetical protein
VLVNVYTYPDDYLISICGARRNHAVIIPALFGKNVVELFDFRIFNRNNWEIGGGEKTNIRCGITTQSWHLLHKCCNTYVERLSW